MTKRMSYTVCFKLDVVELAKATIGIQGKNYRDRIRNQRKACAGLEEEKD